MTFSRTTPCYLSSAFFLLHSLRDGGLSGFSKFRVRGSRFKVRRWMLDVGCWMFSAPLSAFCPPHFSISAFPPPGTGPVPISAFQLSGFQRFSVSALVLPVSAFCFPNFSFSPGPPRRAGPVPISGLTRFLGPNGGAPGRGD
jgi:hypothetical protein